MSAEAWMAEALALAEGALGWTAPNPAVGAVVVVDGIVVGRGFTQPAGQAHAEIVALADARARGAPLDRATLVVTLEPCCHHGRTPPCTEAILAAGIQRVIVGVVDPYPAMRGRSMALLRAAGLEVVCLEHAACHRQIRGFARALTHGLPEVTLKVGVSIDGHLATAAGESQWITGEAARQDAHRLRATHDAIAVGIGTVLADDPVLTTRWPTPDIGGRPVTHPRPVIFDTALRTPATARVRAHPRGCVIVCADDAPEAGGDAEVLRVPRGPHGVDVEAALRGLVGLGIHRLLVEGGAQLHRALIDSALVDELVIYQAPVLIPGGRSWVGGPPVAALADARRGEVVDHARIGPDTRTVVRFPHRMEA
jgi:diaminohydroxyphosphoribosylaminopyrimidine deaminase/5-amino-6-(5-phosphoribosylamino)uracil reductase